MSNTARKFFYTVTMTNHDGDHVVSQVLTSLREARRWAAWLRTRTWASGITIWCGQPGGERVA